MNRRKAIQHTTLILGGALSSSLLAGVLSGCEADPALDWAPQALSPRQAVMVADLVERILPATDTPGAKEALVDRFVDSMVAEFLPEAEQKVFFDGLAVLERKGFSKKPPFEQDKIVSELAEAAKEQGTTAEPKPFFLLVKEMTLLGFFSSEIGATQVLNYDPIPGGYQGCKPLDEVGGKTWAM